MGLALLLIAHFMCMCSINSVSKPELTEEIDDHHQGANKAWVHWFGLVNSKLILQVHSTHGKIPRLGLVSVLHVKYLQNNNKIIVIFTLFWKKKSKTKIVTSKSSSHVNSSHIHTTFWKKRELLHELPRESSLVFWCLCVCAFKSKMKSVYSRVATKKIKYFASLSA